MGIASLGEVVCTDSVCVEVVVAERNSGGETMVEVEAAPAAEQDEGGTVGQANGCLVSPAARGRRYLGGPLEM